MAKKSNSNAELVKRLLKQIAGNVTEDDELIPEVGIRGHGDIWCWYPSARIHRKISRGVKAFVLYENFDIRGRTLIYTYGGDMVCIEPSDLLATGYD